MPNTNHLETLNAKLFEIKATIDLNNLLESMGFFAILEAIELVDNTQSAVFNNLVAHAGAIINKLEQMFTLKLTKNPELKTQFTKVKQILDQIILTALQGTTSKLKKA